MPPPSRSHLDMFSQVFSLIQSRSLVLSACISILLHLMPPCQCVVV